MIILLGVEKNEFWACPSLDCVCVFFSSLSMFQNISFRIIFYHTPITYDNGHTNCYFQINHNFFPLSMLDTLTSSSISPMRIRKKKNINAMHLLFACVGRAQLVRGSIVCLWWNLGLSLRGTYERTWTSPCNRLVQSYQRKKRIIDGSRLISCILSRCYRYSVCSGSYHIFCCFQCPTPFSWKCPSIQSKISRNMEYALFFFLAFTHIIVRRIAIMCTSGSPPHPQTSNKYVFVILMRPRSAWLFIKFHLHKFWIGNKFHIHSHSVWDIVQFVRRHNNIPQYTK